MSRSDDARVADILEAANQIADVVARGKAAWDEDRIGQLAVERLLEIIGESARAMSDAARRIIPTFRGATSSDFASCSPTTTTASTPTRSG